MSLNSVEERTFDSASEASMHHQRFITSVAPSNGHGIPQRYQSPKITDYAAATCLDGTQVNYTGSIKYWVETSASM